MGKRLYLPSTPLNTLVSVAVALQQPKEERQQLALIDQRLPQVDNPLFQALAQWPQSPFESMVYSQQFGSGLTSPRHLKTSLQHWSETFETFQPDWVAVGNDRRIEFQYLMQGLAKQEDVTGAYLDDGLYSYCARPWHWYKQGVNGWLKKWFVGNWWQEPKAIGESSWIEQAYLFQPEQALSSLKCKSTHKLKSTWFTSQKLLALSQLVAESFDFDLQALKATDVVLLIPHPNNLKKMPDQSRRLIDLAHRLNQAGRRLAVKYHPRFEQTDALNFKQNGAQVVIPSGMAFEFCLPAFKRDALVIGDVGTGLYTTRWLRPDMTSVAWLDPSQAFQSRFVDLSFRLGVEVVTTDKELEAKCGIH
ncbi:MAG: hypothetical protein RI556_08565 [Hydrogenovibrio sp.]|uniref:hypothetical protein n=1 Tax=Hydrogenovibrio sp. TaxID=2065821 RepID=UPI002870834D|nr:hypothetical protein [Hydrogenovibrio sp.]MDR9498557.1 hypothetical protein [Hydrogenovibrio sp.]MDR9499213.1 hypothetical protein [Hydrogenovibrio sp.]